MWIKANPNPLNKEVPDCVIRAISIALNQPWIQTFDELYSVARMNFKMPSQEPCRMNAAGFLIFLLKFIITQIRFYNVYIKPDTFSINKYRIWLIIILTVNIVCGLCDT